MHHGLVAHRRGWVCVPTSGRIARNSARTTDDHHTPCTRSRWAGVVYVLSSTLSRLRIVLPLG